MKPVMGVGAKKIIGALLPPANFRAAFDFDFALGLNQSGADSPNPNRERAEEGLRKSSRSCAST
jgi:hypothetical protein